MTITIPSRSTNKSVKIVPSIVPGGVAITIEDPDHGALITTVVAIPGLLDAVRSELGVLTIDKADLPDVVVDGVGDVYVNGGWYSDDVEAHRETALRHLAIAAHLEAHPPVDEESVAALANILEGVVGGCADGWDWADVARQTIRSGRVDVQS